jgi:hypothetical protein
LTLKTIPGFQPSAPIDPTSLLDHAPPASSETKFENTGRISLFDHETVLQEIKEH